MLLRKRAFSTRLYVERKLVHSLMLKLADCVRIFFAVVRRTIRTR